MEGQREIEVKYRVDDLARLETALRTHRLVLSAGVDQDDQAYAPVGWRFGMSKVGVPFARLRTEGSRHLFTVKVPVENSMSCLEHETEVADRDQMHRAILAMGLYPTVRIRKTRRSAWSGQLRICVDDVESLGVFLELERVVDQGESGVDVQAALDRFARSLEVPMERATQTYDSLVRAATSGVVGDAVLARRLAAWSGERGRLPGGKGGKWINPVREWHELWNRRSPLRSAWGWRQGDDVWHW